MQIIHWIIFVFSLALSAGTAFHALLYKRNSRASLGWIAVCLTFPVAGPCLYLLFGINRVRTQARKLRDQWDHPADESLIEDSSNGLAHVPEHLHGLARIGEGVTKRPLHAGNSAAVLHNGEQAYPSMLEAMENASSHIYLSTYIFETNATGRQFVDVMAAAVDRGVDVRVILDGVGELYSLPWAGRLLKKRSIRVARFLPPRLIPFNLAVNLRNHRKILVVDGKVGFTGGMNIGGRHLAADQSKPNRVVDIHFRFQGPVIEQLEKIFLADWAFCTTETSDPRPMSDHDAGPVLCRTIMDGPDHDIDKLALVLAGAASAGKSRLSIMTPYFLPSRELIGALNAASLRGVDVSVITPERNNLPYVRWASHNLMWELLQRGVRIYEQPPPFVHSKLFLVDNDYALIGSANIDDRSLRLNFELGVEMYDTEVVGQLNAHFDAVKETSRRLTLKELDGRSLPVRTRDSLCWLFTPYL